MGQKGAVRSVFVTGALGYIGRAVADRYRSLGAEVRGVDLRGDPEAGIVAGDVGRPGEWQEHVRGCELIVHTAASISMRLERPEEIFQANVAGTANVVDAAERAGAGRMIQVSSVTVFGPDFPDGVDERYPVHPIGIPYVDSKIAGERFVLQAHLEDRVPVTVVRPGEVYGPGSPSWSILPTEMIEARKFALPARGRSIFSPVYVDNLVDGITLAATTPEASGQVITLTDGIGVETREFFAPYAELVGRKLVTVPTRLAQSAAWVAHKVARHTKGGAEMHPALVAMMARTGTYSIERARRLLGYAPAVDLDEGQRRTIAWLREHRAASAPA